jgi:hypothetical protein
MTVNVNNQTFTKFDGLRIELQRANGRIYARLMVPRGPGLPDQMLSESSIHER